VRIRGLLGRPDLNEQAGVAVRWDADAGRWEVRCGAETIRIKPANLTALPAPRPALAGEIGFSIGHVYTSLSGWTGERTSEAVGTAQLMLLGRWLRRRGYAFWSLGHCYSPEMDYKRQLGHRIYTREQFRALLKRHRGPFELSGASAAAAAAHGLRPADQIDEADLLELSGAQGDGPQPRLS